MMFTVKILRRKDLLKVNIVYQKHPASNRPLFMIIHRSLPPVYTLQLYKYHTKREVGMLDGHGKHAHLPFIAR